MTRKIAATDYRALADKLTSARLPNRLGVNAAAAIHRLVDAYLDLYQAKLAEQKVIAAARKLCCSKANEATAAYRELEIAVVALHKGLN
jgi:hypothetical protein